MKQYYVIVVSVHVEKHNIHITYITTYPPSGTHTFNTAWIALHMLQERIHVLRKGPQGIPRSPRPRCVVVVSRTADTQPLPHDRDCPQARLVLRDGSGIHITRWEDTYLLTLSSVRRYRIVNYIK
jgi:hypothetical protein